MGMNSLQITTLMIGSYAYACPYQRFEWLAYHFLTVGYGCFDADEARLSAALTDDAPGPFYHGGSADLQPGDFLLPPEITKADPRDQGELVADRSSWVYVTDDMQLAASFAAQTGGFLYEVKPHGLIADPSWLRTNRLARLCGAMPRGPKMNSFACAAALIERRLPWA